MEKDYMVSLGSGDKIIDHLLPGNERHMHTLTITCRCMPMVRYSSDGRIFIIIHLDADVKLRRRIPTGYDLMDWIDWYEQ